jgi:predicted AAA+ superfamily ATPase
MYIRKQTFRGLETESTFFWGARQTGKSTLLKQLFPDEHYIDLLLNNEFERFQRNPSLLREILETSDPGALTIIDEIQRIPELLNEIHWMLVNRNQRFILCGSSPRKILRSGANLLGGRALRYELYPLVYPEIPDFDLLRALKHGLLPRHYMASDPVKLLSAYIGSYLKEEIMAEARIRNIRSFTRFLEVAAFTNGEVVNYSNIASECGISAPTVKEYFQILEDTLTGRFLPSYQKKPQRRVIQAPKFYYFDVGIANHLLKRGSVEMGSESFGKAFEHLLYQEMTAHRSYSDLKYPIHYWRTTSQFEVDFILGDHEVAVEVKSTPSVNPRHLKGLLRFAEEYTVKRQIVVSNDPDPRKIGEIEILPWKQFLEKLWSNELIS